MRLLVNLIAIFLLAACADQDDTSVQSAGLSDDAKPLEEYGATSTSSAKNESDAGSPALVARLGKQALSGEDLDAGIQLPLFDLEWAKYELRTKALARQVEEFRTENPNAMVEVLIEPPMPPRLTAPEVENQPTLGTENAPVTLSVFCNYQSAHCVRMQEAYASLASQYGSLVRFVFYDVPLRFHRDAFDAAVAARCALEQNRFSGFHRALWASSHALNLQTYQLTAQQLGVGLENFDACLQSDEIAQRVAGNLAYAEEMGFKNVPVTLINGLYVNGPKDASILSYFIDHELSRLNIESSTRVASMQQELIETDKPLRLEGVTLGARPDQGSALIQYLGNKQTQHVRAGDSVIDETTLVAVFDQYVILNSKGQLEKLSLRASEAQREHLIEEQDDAYLAKIEQAALASGNVLDTDELPPSDLEYQYRGVIAPQGEKPLSREWLEEQLANQQALQAHFKPAELEVEGVRIMRLENIQENNFYQTLGLQENDVIMRVNGEWLHEGQNTLFSSLEQGDNLSLILMRKGLPIHYQYSIN